MSLKKGCELYSISLHRDCIFAKVILDKVSKEFLHFCTHSKRYGFSCKIVQPKINK